MAVLALALGSCALVALCSEAQGRSGPSSAAEGRGVGRRWSVAVAGKTRAPACMTRWSFFFLWVFSAPPTSEYGALQPFEMNLFLRTPQLGLPIPWLKYIETMFDRKGTWFAQLKRNQRLRSAHRSPRSRADPFVGSWASPIGGLPPTRKCSFVNGTLARNQARGVLGSLAQGCRVREHAGEPA